MSSNINISSTQDKKSSIYNFRFIVEKDDLDIYGHMNNAKYLEYYEKARWDILEQTIEGKKIVEANLIGLIVLEINIKFKKELKQESNVLVVSQNKIVGNRLIYYDQKMYNENNELCNAAIFKATLLDLKTRKMIRPDDKWIKIFGY